MNNSSPEEGAKVEAMTDFIFLDSQITVDGDCSPEIKKMFAPWKGGYDNASAF